MHTSSDSTFLQDRRGEILGLPDGPVTSVTRHPNGEVWAGTPSGLYRGTPEEYSVRFESVPEFSKDIGSLRTTPLGVGFISGGALHLLNLFDNAPSPRSTIPLSEPPLRWGWIRGIRLVYPDRLVQMDEGEAIPIEIPAGITLRDTTETLDGRSALVTAEGAWVRRGDEWISLRLKEASFIGEGGIYSFAPSTVVNSVQFDFHGHLWMATEDGVLLWNGGEYWEHLGPADGLPMKAVHSLRFASDGSRWFVHPRGVSRLREGEWRYFAGRRWLPDDTVTQVVSDDQGGVFAATASGLGWIAAEPMTLEEKAERFHARLRERHARHGYVSTSVLTSPGDLSTSIHEAGDNDGLWTALYVAAEGFRYRVTGDPQAKANAVESMAAMERLEQVTPIPGFPARALILNGERVWKSDPEKGEWHPFSVPDIIFQVQGESDGGPALNLESGTSNRVEGEWKGDTSSDELVGHFFACAVFHDTIDDEEWKGRVAAYAGRIADHLLQNDFNLIDLDGKHTRWGFYSPRILNTEQGRAQRGLNSLEVLQHLKVAHALTGEDRFGEAYLHLVRDHHYALNTLRQKVTVPGHVNHSDDELAFLSYYPLLRYETDPDLLALYRKSFRRSWEIERPERSPFMNVLYGAVMGGPCDADLSRKALEEIPLDIVHWTMENSHRDDLPREAADDRFARPQSTRALSPAERGMLKWNGNPYRLDDGGGGGSEEDGAFFLLPYWMGRALGLL